MSRWWRWIAVRSASCTVFRTTFRSTLWRCAGSGLPSGRWPSTASTAHGGAATSPTMPRRRSRCPFGGISQRSPAESAPIFMGLLHPSHRWQYDCQTRNGGKYHVVVAFAFVGRARVALYAQDAGGVALPPHSLPSPGRLAPHADRSAQAKTAAASDVLFDQRRRLDRSGRGFDAAVAPLGARLSGPQARAVRSGNRLPRLSPGGLCR